MRQYFFAASQAVHSRSNDGDGDNTLTIVYLTTKVKFFTFFAYTILHFDDTPAAKLCCSHRLQMFIFPLSLLSKSNYSHKEVCVVPMLIKINTHNKSNRCIILPRFA